MFADQLTKLHLWSLAEEYDWIFYADSDVFILSSMLPCISHVLSSMPAKIAAVRDVDSFNTGMFMIQPSTKEFDSLMCMLHGNSSHCRAVKFAEQWMEQGLLNEAYWKNWTEMPATCSMNLELWTNPWKEHSWDPNATSISAIHFTCSKPWDWYCPLTEFAPLCYLFWNERTLRFHRVEKKKGVFS